jgi:type IV secretory pathway VirJ component
MANQTIGTVTCPLLGDEADVRKDKNGKLYYVGDAGIIAPKSALGQRWLKQHVTLDNLDVEEAKNEKEFKPPVEQSSIQKTKKNMLEKLLDEALGGDDD